MIRAQSLTRTSWVCLRLSLGPIRCCGRVAGSSTVSGLRIGASLDPGPGPSPTGRRPSLPGLPVGPKSIYQGRSYKQIKALYALLIKVSFVKSTDQAAPT